MAPRPPVARPASGPTERFLARVGRDRERFLREHFAAAWGWYERLTLLCTLGRVRRWRERCVAACALGPDARVLDIATGTGPLLFHALRRLGPSGLAVGLDLSHEGLLDGRAAAGEPGARARWIQGRAVALPFPDASFDSVVIGFALRHLGPPGQVLRELHRVLVPGGRLGIVDFFHPRPGLLSWAGLAYLFWVVPVVSAVLTRQPAVWRLARYLPHTILDALGPDAARAELRAAGFAIERAECLAAGIVWLFVGRATAAVLLAPEAPADACELSVREDAA